jgi:hypothetical protein
VDAEILRISTGICICNADGEQPLPWSTLLECVRYWTSTKRRSARKLLEDISV